MSRKIDALIAEHVMGLDYIPTLPRDPMWLHLPHYSTDIAAAWEVMAKLSHTKWGQGFTIRFRPLKENQGYVQFGWHGGGSPPEAILEFERIPMAICLAALKAKGIEHE